METISVFSGRASGDGGGGGPLPLLVALLAALILVGFSGCKSAKVRYDAAPSPVDLNQQTVLLETTCNGVVRAGFGQAGCAWRADELPEGKLTVHTPLPGSIQLYSRECGIDETAFHAEKGGSFEYELARLMPADATFCRVSLFVRWQLPEGMTSDFKLRGMLGRLYLRRARKNAALVPVQWEGATTGTLGVAWAQFRAVDRADPLGLVMRLPKKVVAGKWRLYGCGHGVDQADFQGDTIRVTREQLLGAQPKKGSCDLFGFAVGLLEDGSPYDGDLAVSYEVFDSTALKLATSITIEKDEVCYEAEDAVSLALISANGKTLASNKLADCFQMPTGGRARLGFFTAQGRASYAIVEGGKVEYLQ